MLFKNLKIMVYFSGKSRKDEANLESFKLRISGLRAGVVT